MKFKIFLLTLYQTSLALKKSIFLYCISIVFISCKTTNKDENKINIGFSQCISTDEWRKDMDHSMIVEASLNPNIDLTIKNAKRNTQKQIEQIEELINENNDILIISPHESKPLIPVIEKAFDKGIPVILLDRKVESEKYTAFIGADNFEIGKLAGRYIASNSNAKGNIVEIYADLDTSPGYGRSQGFRELIKKYPQLKILKSIEANPSGFPVKELEDLLQNASIDYIYAFNDVIAKQCWDIAKRLGKEKRIKIIGVDGLNGKNGGIQYVKDGVLTATILYPTGGSEAIKTALKIANNEKISKNIRLTTVLVDSLNANIMSNQFDKITQQQSNIENQQYKIKEQDRAFTNQYNLNKLLILFLVIIFFLAAYSLYSVITISKKKKLLEIKNDEILHQRNEIGKFADDLKISNEAKISFFTGLSHEFKTPLTLILSTIESIKEESSTFKSQYTKDINLMYNNSRRLLRLINQLLDYRKIEEKVFTLKPSKTNIWKFSKKIFKEFEREAKNRNIDYTISTSNEDIEVYIDRNLMDKVYFNLLSNAFKFTPDNGKISIEIKKDNITNNLILVFKDSGIGIPENELDEVFNIFFQGSNNNKRSSGIGLNLTKNFIDLHNGTITINSDLGTEFIINLKLGTNHLDPNSIITEFVKDEYEYDHLDIDVLNINDNIQNDEKPSLAIIEDNLELLDFMASKLEADYNVYKSNGINSVEFILEIIPDIIICDLQLPERNGFEICQIIKSDMRTSHIPTIILTAIDDQDTYLKALEVGADLFLTKPFNLKVLKQSLKATLFNREKSRIYFSKIVDEKAIEDDFYGLQERDFLNKLNNLIQQNIDNSDFSIEDLADKMCISRVQLYRKIKAILNISVSDYVNSIKLEKAKDLLKNTTLNIAEIAYSCGFASPNYFSTSFKNKYGFSPKEFRND